MWLKKWNRNALLFIQGILLQRSKFFITYNTRDLHHSVVEDYIVDLHETQRIQDYIKHKIGISKLQTNQDAGTN